MKVSLAPNVAIIIFQYCYNCASEGANCSHYSARSSKNSRNNTQMMLVMLYKKQCLKEILSHQSLLSQRCWLVSGMVQNPDLDTASPIIERGSLVLTDFLGSPGITTVIHCAIHTIRVVETTCGVSHCLGQMPGLHAFEVPKWLLQFDVQYMATFTHLSIHCFQPSNLHRKEVRVHVVTQHRRVFDCNCDNKRLVHNCYNCFHTFYILNFSRFYLGELHVRTQMSELRHYPGFYEELKTRLSVVGSHFCPPGKVININMKIWWSQHQLTTVTEWCNTGTCDTGERFNCTVTSLTLWNIGNHPGDFSVFYLKTLTCSKTDPHSMGAWVHTQLKWSYI